MCFSPIYLCDKMNLFLFFSFHYFYFLKKKEGSLPNQLGKDMWNYVTRIVEIFKKMFFGI